MIEVRNLFKRFGEQEVLRGVSLNVPKGAITAIMGPSGEGKSVLLKHLIGLLRPDSGRIRIGGEEITSLTEAEMNRVRRKIGMLFQEGALFDYLDVLANVSFPLHEHTDLSDEEIRRRVVQRLEEVGLTDVLSKLPGELSGGMRKRVALARALMLEPTILFFDEPTTGLDPIMTEQISDLIAQTHHRLGVTVLLISHDLSVADKIANHVAMLYQGTVVHEGTPASLRESEHPFVKRYVETSAKRTT